jgi:hypothetical protein
MGRENGPGASTRPPERGRPAPPATAPSAQPLEWPQPSRNLFEYGGERPGSAPAPPPAPAPTSVEPAPAPVEPPLRLVGLVRHRDGLKAALSFSGEVVVLAPGEGSGGYTLLQLDDEAARLVTPGGDEVVLRLPDD